MNRDDIRNLRSVNTKLSYFGILSPPPSAT
jgi:hypothetical protein